MMELDVRAVEEEDECRGIGERYEIVNSISGGKVEIELSYLYQRKVIMSC